MSEWTATNWKVDGCEGAGISSAGVISGGNGVSSMIGAAEAAAAALATEVVIQRTEGQVFRERVGFVILCIIGAYCSMRILIELKSILEPFLWAVFLVMAWKPVVDAVQKRTERALGVFCYWLRKEARKERTDLPADLMDILDDEDPESATPLSELSGSVQPTDQSGHESRSRRLSSADASQLGKRPRALRDGQQLGRDDFERAEGLRAAWRKRLSRGVAVLIALMLTLGLLSGLGFLILDSARRMRSHWDVYQKGAQKLTTEAAYILGKLFQKVPERMRTRYEDITSEVMTSAQDFIYALLGNLVNNVTSLFLGGLLTLLYTLFWLCSPVPMDSSVDIMFRRYIMFKTLACIGYGFCVGILLALLSIDLAAVFALITFALNYVPEVGPFVAMILPCPVILLDSRLERPFLVLMAALGGQLALKFAFSNILEVKLIESDKKLRMHPVMILLSVGIFGHLWGPTGMLLSVPLMALLKIALFSDLVPASYRDPILVLLEGDRDAPRIHHGTLHGPSAGVRTAAPGG